MRKIVECVPNFSEGRDKKIIDEIVNSIKSIEGVYVLDVDPGADTNRTVVTFIGDPDSILEGAFMGIKKASELIDMRKHKGEHPRMGATDVCPFVPVSGISMEECIEITKKLGKRVWEELKIPVYLYEYAATSPERKSLSNIRAGEYEGLPEKLKKPEWKPDFGEPYFNEKSGATVIGAREFLIAYNINFNTRNKKKVHQIALNIREKGRAKRDEKGKIVRDEKGNKIMVPGKFKELRAIGWYIEEYGCAQLSMNFTNYKITPPHIVFDEVCKEAEEVGLRVTGSELVGLIPLEAILMAGKHYLKKQGGNTGVPEKELVHIAVKSLGLSDIVPFDPYEKIIEYKLEKLENKNKLIDLSIKDFNDELSSDSPAPGGGSVAALSGSISASLSSMVAALTFSKKGYEDVRNEMANIGEETQKIKYEFLRDIDLDTDAFNKVMAAFKLPKKSEEDKKIRKEKIEEATKEATLIPLGVLKKSVKSLEYALEVAKKGNINSLSDAGVAGLTGETCAWGAYYNVLINLQSIEDKNFVVKVKNEAKEYLEKAVKISKEIKEHILTSLEN